MRKFIVFMLALPVVAMMVSLAGCKDDPPPPPEPVRSSSPGPASPSATPSPVSQQPAPPPAPTDDGGYSDYGLLETAERYYVNGDEDAPYCIFFSDDTVQDEYGAEGMFEARGSYIYIYFNGSHVGTLTIIDAYTLEDEESGVRWIREGGDGFGADAESMESGESAPPYVSIGLPPIIFGKNYYLEGDTDDVSLYFWEDGDVDIEGGAENIYAEYIYTGEEIIITRGGQVILVLVVVNPAELEDVNSWDCYYFEGAHDYELETYERYYLNGDEDDVQLWFWSDGTVDVTNPDGDAANADYYVDGYSVYIDIGYEVELEIVNSYVLRDDEGNVFVRLP